MMRTRPNLAWIFILNLALAAFLAGPHRPFSRRAGLAIALADDVATLKATQDAPERRKQLHFEDELIEGMNHNPFDSLEHIANEDLRDNSHLYKKKANFRVEMKQQVRDAGYTQ